LVKQQATETEHLRGQVQQCLASVQTCSSGIELLQTKVDEIDRKLNDCATRESVTTIMESLTSEKEARLKSDEATKQIQETLGSDGQKLVECQTLCKDLETRVLDISNMLSAEQASVKQEIGELSLQVGKSIQLESRCFQEIEHTVQGLTERCYLTNMILATERLKQETQSLGHQQNGAARDAQALTCDVASKGISEIGATLEALRHGVSLRHAGGAGHGFQRGPAAGGALQAARATRRQPSAAS